MNIGSMRLRQGKIKEAISLLREGAQLAKRLGDLPRQGQALGNIGLALLDSGRPRESLQYFRKAKALFTDLGAHNEIGFSEENLGDVHTKLGNYLQAKKHHQEAILVFKRLRVASRVQEISAKLEALKTTKLTDRKAKPSVQFKQTTPS